MEIIIDDIIINYEISGVGPPLIFLHGWGLDLNTFNNLTKQINDDFTVYQIDLPGFGKSTLTKAMSISEYALVIFRFCEILDIKKPIILGHSFGGRVAIKCATLFPLDKLILVSSPGVKMRFNLVKFLKIKCYKVLKFLKIKNKMGSKDYKNASIVLKQTLVMAVNEDLSCNAKKINVPTLLIYGKKDKDVPLYIGKEMNRLIKSSALIICDSKHFPYIEKFRYFFIVLKSFLLGGFND